MKYCCNCLQMDTRPNIQFSDEGICPACAYSLELPHVDWRERFEILKTLLANFSRAPGQYFDCIIGVSGGKDSTRQALWVRDKLGLRPLLACLSYPPPQVSQRGVDNLSNLIDLGFDMVVSAPAPETWRGLVRESFLRYTNWCKSTELALFSSVPQLAIRYKIPLIFWGENPGLQIGDLSTLGRTGYDGNGLRYMNTLAGGAMSWMLEAGYPEGQLNPYRYPDPAEFEKSSLQIVYLGWFLKDWSMVNNGAYSCVYGLAPRHNQVLESGDLYGVSALDEDWVAVNQLVKYYKFGFGKASEYVNEEIRLGRMDRAQAISIVEEFDGRCSHELIAGFCDYISISVDRFWEIVCSAANKDLFSISSGGTLVRKFKIGFGL